MNSPVNYSLSFISSAHPRFHRRNGVATTCALRRHHRRRRNFKNPTQSPPSSSPSDSNLQMVIDIEYLSTVAPLSFQTHLNKFIDSANEALEDLQTLIVVDPNQKVRISCRKSTVQFVGNLVICGLVIVLGFRVLVKIGEGFRNRFGFGNGGRGVITRRDRSLGGREVVVGKRNSDVIENRVLENPLSPASGDFGGVFKSMPKNWGLRREKKLPNWWPDSNSAPVEAINRDEYQKQANRLIRAIMDYRMSGKDIQMDDIVQLRQICRISGVRVSINTTNSQNSLYRASVDFVLNICGSVPSPSAFVQIIGEDAREFIAGLADNIGLEKYRAARMVTAAVAARTRSWLLQAWALEMQGKHSEAVVELSKLSLTHRIFPPEESSPEMEMVARGLEKHLKLDQREYLMNMLIEMYGEGSCKSVAEALGLMISPEGVDQQQNKYTELKPLQ